MNEAERAVVDIKFILLAQNITTIQISEK